VVCIETRHAQRFLSSRPVKTDKNDARGIAEMMRLGHYRPVHVKSPAAQSMRTTLVARMQLVASQLQIEGTIRGLLKVYGLKIGAVHRNRFSARVLELLEMAALPELSAAIEPLLRVREGMRTERKLADRTPSRVGPALRRRAPPDDHPWRRPGDQPRIHRYSRRAQSLWHLESARSTSRPDATRVSVR
jgi:transposase